MFARIVIILALVAQFSSRALSDTFSAFADGGAGACPGASFINEPTSQSFSGVTCTGLPGSSTVSAKSGYGYLGSSVSGVGNPSTDAAVNFTVGLSQSVDPAVTLSGGMITFYFAMDGVLSIAPGSLVELTVSGAVDNQPALDFREVVFGSTNGPQAQTPTGTPKQQTPTVTPSGFYSGQLITTPIKTHSGDYLLHLGFDNVIQGSASSNFLNTIQLAEITVTDQTTGQPINGITFTDTNGDVFAANQPLLTPVPEPNTAWLVVSFFISLIAIKHRGNQQHAEKPTSSRR